MYQYVVIGDSPTAYSLTLDLNFLFPVAMETIGF